MAQKCSGLGMSYVLTTSYASPEAPQPADCAARLALAMQCPLRLVHAYTVPFVIGEFPAPAIAPDDLRQIAGTQLEATEAALRQRHPGLRLETALGYGTLAEVLQDSIGKETPLLVVIGNDETEHPDTMLGTDTAYAMGEIERPVLAVAPEAGTGSISHLCLALRAASLDEAEALEGLGSLHAKLGFRLSVVTVSEGDEEPESGSSPLREQLTALGASFETIRGSASETSRLLEDFATGHGADCLGVLKQERGFFSALFHRSQTEALLRHTRLPVMSFHTGRRA